MSPPSLTVSKDAAGPLDDLLTVGTNIPLHEKLTEAFGGQGAPEINEEKPADDRTLSLDEFVKAYRDTYGLPKAAAEVGRRVYQRIQNRFGETIESHEVAGFVEELNREDDHLDAGGMIAEIVKTKVKIGGEDADATGLEMISAPLSLTPYNLVSRTIAPYDICLVLGAVIFSAAIKDGGKTYLFTHTRVDLIVAGLNYPVVTKPTLEGGKLSWEKVDDITAKRLIKDHRAELLRAVRECGSKMEPEAALKQFEGALDSVKVMDGFHQIHGGRYLYRQIPYVKGLDPPHWASIEAALRVVTDATQDPRTTRRDGTLKSRRVQIPVWIVEKEKITRHHLFTPASPK